MKTIEPTSWDEIGSHLIDGSTGEVYSLMGLYRKHEELLSENKKLKGIEMTLADHDRLMGLLNFEKAVDFLTEDEGETLILGGLNSVVICNGDWTEWEDVRFEGKSRRECLEKAVEVKKKWEEENA